jgi:uncharacterized paraquat-inducible protein A
MSTAICVDVHCQRCGMTFELPELSDLLKGQLAEIARSGTIFEVIRQLNLQKGVERHSAKCLALHMTRVPGTCHRCHYPLLLSGQSKCPKCDALNLDW